jgi:acryloyl-coenzyme A reductase
LKAIRLSKFGLKPVICDVPLPQDLAKDEALVQIELTGICYRDILTVKGFFPRTKLPVILGHEVAGKVVKLGSDESGFREGDRVVSLIYVPCGRCEFCASGRENLCRSRRTYGEDLDGSYAEFIKVNVRSLVRAPTGVPAEGLAISACVTGMVLHALRERAKLIRGETVLVTGAGGGVGIHAVQVARALGARVIAATTSEWKATSIRNAGANEVLTWSTGFADEVKKLTEGSGVDIVLEAVGGPSFPESLRSLSWGGRMVVVGNVTPAPVQLSLGPLILKENGLLGSLSSTKKDVVDALEMTARGDIKPVARVLPLEDATKGHELMEERSTLGRVLLRP